MNEEKKVAGFTVFDTRHNAFYGGRRHRDWPQYPEDIWTSDKKKAYKFKSEKSARMTISDSRTYNWQKDKHDYKNDSQVIEAVFEGE